MEKATAQQQINFLQQLAINREQIINAAGRNEDDDAAYNIALRQAAAQVLNISKAQIEDVLDELQFTCDVADKCSQDDDMLFILFDAQIDQLIDQVQYTYDLIDDNC